MGKEVFDLLSKISNNPKKLVSSGVLAYLCVNCEGSICMTAISSTEAQTSPPATPTVVSALKQDEVIPPSNEAAPVNVVSTENDELHKMEKKICSFYRFGNCRHGSSGKNIVNGRICNFFHPKKCSKYCRHGYDRERGCMRSCSLFHPVMCRSSLDFGECYDLHCNLQHLQGTIRGDRSFRRGISNDPSPHTRFTPPNRFTPQVVRQNGYNYSHPVSSSNSRFAQSAYRNSMQRQETRHNTYNYSPQSFPPLITEANFHDKNISFKPENPDQGASGRDPLLLIMNQLKDLQQQSAFIKEELNLLKAKEGLRPLGQNNNMFQTEIGQRNNQTAKNFLDANDQYRG